MTTKELLKAYETKRPEVIFEWRDAETDACGWVVINSMRGGAAAWYGEGGQYAGFGASGPMRYLGPRITNEVAAGVEIGIRREMAGRAYWSMGGCGSQKIVHIRDIMFK